MKNAIIIVSALLLSCKDETPDNVIVYKSNFDFYSKPLPKGICRFSVGDGQEYRSFDDSCHFYHMLDTIK